MIEKFDEIAKSVKKSLIPPRILLSKFRFLEENSRYSRACMDHFYLPFYYYLGKHFPVKSLLDIGFGLGLNAGLYFMGCPNVENYLAIQEPSSEYYSARIGKANIKQTRKFPFKSDVNVCSSYDEQFVKKMRSRKWELAFINEKHGYDAMIGWMNHIWDVMEEGGVMCIEYTTIHESVKKAYNDFCKIKQRTPYVFPTRYGVGAIVR
jgi:hypothetical protein